MEKITYEELGKLLIKDLCEKASFLEDENQIIKNELSEKYAKTLEKINRNEIKLVGDEEDQHEYISLYQSLLLGYEKRQTLEQQLQASVILLEGYLDKIKTRQEAEKIIEKYPLLLTSKQYQDIILFVEQKKINQKESYENLVFKAFLYYSYDAPDTEIAKEIKKTQFNRNENTYKNDLQLFIKEHEKLYNMIKDDILKHDELKFLENIEPIDYKKKTIRNRILKSLDMYSYKVLLENHSMDEIKEFLLKRSSMNYARAEFSGISILEEEFYTEDIIDERGYYIDPTHNILKSLEGIEQIAKNEKTKEIIRDTIFDVIDPTVISLYAWRTFIDLVVRKYGINEIEAFKINGFDFEKEINNLNKEIANTWFSFTGTGIQIDRKRSLFNFIFSKINLEELKTPQKNIDKVCNEILNYYPVTQNNLQEILGILAGA